MLIWTLKLVCINRYLIGGDSGNAGAGPLGTVERYDIVSNTWYHNIPSLNNAREQCASFTYGEHIYCTGGLAHAAGNSALSSIEALCIRDTPSMERGWIALDEKKREFALPEKLYGHFIVIADDSFIVLLGGIKGHANHASTAVWVIALTKYDNPFDHHTWEWIPSIPLPKHINSAQIATV